MSKYSYNMGLQLKDSAGRKFHCREIEMGTQGVHFTMSKIKMITIKNCMLAPFKLSYEKFKSCDRLDLQLSLP